MKALLILLVSIICAPLYFAALLFLLWLFEPWDLTEKARKQREMFGYNKGLRWKIYYRIRGESNES